MYCLQSLKILKIIYPNKIHEVSKILHPLLDLLLNTSKFFKIIVEILKEKGNGKKKNR